MNARTAHLRPYGALGNVWRGQPCQEYPGCWIVYVNGHDVASFFGADAAKRFARNVWNESADDWAEVAVHWSADDTDPRIGETWFSGFYRLGYYRGITGWHE